MALGESTVTSVRTHMGVIGDLIGKYNSGHIQNGGLYDCWNTFDYVSKSLKEWADDTTIGLETKDNLIKLSNYLMQVIEETTNLTRKITSFCDKQDEINGKKTYAIRL